MVGRLCHGKPRGEREPYPVLAPLLRLVAWTATLLAALCGLAAVVADWRDADAVSDVLFRVAATTGLAAAGVARVFAVMARPGDLLLTAWDTEQRP